MNTTTLGGKPNSFAGLQPDVLATAAALTAKPATGQAPKVEEARIDALMASIDYKTAHLDGTPSTVATARLPGGFVVAVGHSACVSAANFDAEKGRKYAIEDAERKSRHNLWEFEGYALYLRMEQLRAAGVDERMPAHQQRVLLEKAELDDKVAKLRDFVGGKGAGAAIFDNLPSEEQRDLINQLHIMVELSRILYSRIARFPKVPA